MVLLSHSLRLIISPTALYLIPFGCSSNQDMLAFIPDANTDEHNVIVIDAGTLPARCCDYGSGLPMHARYWCY